MNKIPASCPQCGADKIKGMTCREQLAGILAWEWHDPVLYAEHFFTVASYNLQHPAQFTDESIVKLREAFIDHLDNGTPTKVLRRRMAKFATGEKKVLKNFPVRQMILRHWNMTIADVYLPSSPEGAAERVRAWARSIRNELQDTDEVA